MAETTRSKLLRVAAELLDAEGLNAVTLREVGARAGVSRQAPYRHFADKDDLLAAVAEAGLAGLERVATEVADGMSPRHRLDAALIAYVRAALENPELYSLVFSASLSQAKYADLHAVGGLAFALFRELLAALLPADRLDNVAPVIWAATHGVIMLSLSGHNEDAKGMRDPESVVRAALTLALAEHS
ncbi:TetR/AcrR family transcriptional regulator [Microbacterium sp. DT81.1]|uniref:TetR/AcrR family transcriptional regulator n=1 Tax=Microbacterium sp. DT81.1 TaxID=3393413 RepID=UPI003CF444D5